MAGSPLGARGRAGRAPADPRLPSTEVRGFRASAASSLRTTWWIYVLAAAAAAAAVGVVAALLPLTDDPTYVPVIAATALVAWYGGVGPGLLSVAIGFALAYALVGPP